MGSLNRSEKHWSGRVLHDIGSVAADISLFSLPALLYVAGSTDTRIVGLGLLVWTVMIAVATLLRGGWVSPLGSEALGWVSLRYSLVPFRLGWYNLTLVSAVYAGSAVTTGLGGPAGLVAAGGISVLATLSFPTVTDYGYERVLG